MAEHARCYSCRTDRPLTEFAPDKTKASGRTSICKACDREKAHRTYAAKRGAATKRHVERGAATVLPGLDPVLRRTCSREYRAALRADPCAHCGELAGTLDHITPRSAGGGDSWENLTASCLSCNARKGTNTLLHTLGQLAIETELEPLLAERLRGAGSKKSLSPPLRLPRAAENSLPDRWKAA